MVSLVPRLHPSTPTSPYFFLFYPGECADRGNSTDTVLYTYTMGQAKDKGYGLQDFKRLFTTPGAPLYQLSALDSLRTPRHDLTLGVAPGKQQASAAVA